ncbi:MAG: hypothetical protein GY824_25585 [Delftia sp.]|nr:hypothetical protein [Delftia sp.]
MKKHKLYQEAEGHVGEESGDNEEMKTLSTERVRPDNNTEQTTEEDNVEVEEAP